MLLSVAVLCACQVPEEGASTAKDSNTQTVIKYKTVTKTEIKHVDELNETCKIFVNSVNAMYAALSKYETAKGDLTQVIDEVGTAIMTGDKKMQGKADGDLREIRHRVDESLAQLSEAQYAVQNHSDRCKTD